MSSTGAAPPAGRRDGPPSVVVLGGTGFLGRHICAALVTTGARVLRVSATAAAGPDGRDQVALPRSVRLDLCRAERRQLVDLFGEADAEVVVNAAGRVWRSSEREMFEANAELVERVVQAVAELPAPPRVIQLGSVHEYGAAATAGRGITEDQTPDPDTAYGRTKLLGAQAVLAAAHTGHVPGVVLRIAVVCGPGAPRHSLLGHVAHHLAGPARDRPTELRLAPLETRHDFVDVRDLADAVLAAATVPAADLTGLVVNIGRGEAVHVRGLVDQLIALSGRTVRIVEEPSGDTVRSRVRWQQLDISRAWGLLGWRPRRDLVESLRDQLAAAGSRSRVPTV